MRTTGFVAVVLPLLVTGICQAAAIERRSRGCEHFSLPRHDDAPDDTWGARFYSRPNCHNITDSVSDSVGTTERLSSFMDPLWPCAQLKQPARSFHMVGSKGCTVSVWSHPTCGRKKQGKGYEQRLGENSDYSTDEGVENLNPFSLVTTYRWWTEKDLGTDESRWIRSYQVLCDDDYKDD